MTVTSRTGGRGRGHTCQHSGIQLTANCCRRLPRVRFSLQDNSTLTQPILHLPLLVPVERFSDGADAGLFDRIAALGGSGQEEDLFLDVGGEVV